MLLEVGQWEQIPTGKKHGGLLWFCLYTFLAFLHRCFQYVKIMMMFTNNCFGMVCYTATNKLHLCTNTILPL